MDTTTVILVSIAIVAVAVAVWMYLQKERSRKLKQTFGPEYDRIVARERNPRRAEAILDQREKRIAKLPIRALSPEESDHFAVEWRRAQESFVDDPRGAVSRADHLITEALRAKGYPMGDFEQKAADLSVDHPHVVQSYRAAHQIAQRDASGQASTEDLREAMRHYRSLFEDVVHVRIGSYEEVHRNG
jgi:hypothetical protein